MPQHAQHATTQMPPMDDISDALPMHGQVATCAEAMHAPRVGRHPGTRGRSDIRML